MRVRLLLGLALGWLLVGQSARADLFVNFDEDGHGSVISNGQLFPMTSLGNIVDPTDPASGLKPLAYDLTGAPGVGLIPVVGDVLIQEPTTFGPGLSDLLRFTNQGLLLVYSEVETGEPKGALADVGLPISRQTNLVTLLETGPSDSLNGLFGYTPTANQPGFLPIGAPVTYNFVSDAVPEPSSVALLGAGLACGLVLLRSKHRLAD